MEPLGVPSAAICATSFLCLVRGFGCQVIGVSAKGSVGTSFIVAQVKHGYGSPVIAALYVCDVKS